MNSRSPTDSACRAIVRGRVQGVYFRASAAEQATALGLRGFARNQPDGSVVVCALGERAALDRMVAWLRHGPPMARVESVEVESVDRASIAWPAGFLTR